MAVMMNTTLMLNARRLRATLLAIVLAIAVAPAALWAASLDQAKSQGLVGEQANGYLGVVAANAPADVKALVADINQKRKQEYQSIAQRNKTSLDAVEALAGKKAIELTPAGQYVRPPSGQWVRK
jgi:uncharacterized protein YdbL (DUF1318 family)